MCCKRHSDSQVNDCVKYLLFIFNLIFWLIGVAFIVVGIWAYVEKNRFEFNSSDDDEDGGDSNVDIYDIVFDMTILLIVLGGIIFVVAFSGCVGALRENICLLKFFSYALGILFLIQVIIAVLSFVFSSEVKRRVITLLEMEGIARYQGDDPDLTNLIDWFQETFKCCGVGLKGFKDWNNNMYFSCNQTNPSHWKCSVPYSCCRMPNDIDENLINTLCGYDIQRLSYPEAHAKIYTTGCVETILEIARDNLYVIGGVVLGLAVPQLLGVFLARILANQIQDQQGFY